jgi:aryl-alcohol dehydrogenase-like predicted oxidoreductase
MEMRRLGRTGHMSSILTFGAAALWQAEQGEANEAIEIAIARGINHIDVAPSYGLAEARLGPWLEKNRQKVFLGCKTTERSKTRAWESIKRSLENLHTDHFNLFQFHGVNDVETLNAVLSPLGAMEAVLEAKQQGLLNFIGITGHRPFVQVEALNRFDFDTVLFPLNRVLAAHRNDYTDFNQLIEITHTKDVGTIAIKTITKRPWEGSMHMFKTWYEPFSEKKDIEESVWYTLSQDITTAALPGDLKLWPAIIDAAEKFKPMDARTQAEVINKVRHYRPLFPSEV